MGIDIFFKDESLRDCRYALCAEHRKTAVEVVYNDSDEGIPYWQFRRIRRTDFRHQDIELPQEESLFAYEYRMNKVGEEYPEDLPQEMANGLKLLIRQQNKRDVLTKEFLRWVEKQEFDKLVEWCQRQPDENRRSAETAWYGHVDMHAHNTFANPNIVRPETRHLGVRFSAFPHTFPPASVTRLRCTLE